MEIKVTKANGTGNNFVIIYDDKNHHLIKNPNFIKKICDKKIGFNTDGLLLLSSHQNYDYKMDYFNNDGTWETMCANGARCAALFMFNKKLVNNRISFLAGDGVHKIQIKNQDNITLSMIKPSFKSNQIYSNGYKGQYVDSGAKHFATIVNKIKPTDVNKDGKKIRNDQIFSDGINVNFMRIINRKHIQVMTYEKGIENMVLSCGSGSVASAYYAYHKKLIESPLKISVPGGILKLIFNATWDEVWLTGPARLSPETKWNYKEKK